MAIIEITGLEQIAHKLKTVEQIALTLGPPMQQSLMHLQRRVARYPKRHKGPIRWKSEKQRRFYWAMVRRERQWRAAIVGIGEKPGTAIFSQRGNIGAYRRTNTLGRKWSYKVTTHQTFVIGSMTNNSNYGQYVMGDRQQPFHMDTGWQTVDAIAEAEGPKLQRYFDAAIKRAID